MASTIKILVDYFTTMQGATSLLVSCNLGSYSWKTFESLIIFRVLKLRKSLNLLPRSHPFLKIKSSKCVMEKNLNFLHLKISGYTATVLLMSWIMYVYLFRLCD